MFINAIKYKTVKDNKQHIYKFPTTNRLNNFRCHYGARDELTDFTNALKSVFEESPRDNINEVSLFLTDNAGDSWVVDRQSDKTRYLKNGKELKDNIKQTMLGALLDLDMNAQQSIDSSSLLKDYELLTENEHLIAIESKYLSKDKTPLRLDIEGKIAKELGHWQSFLRSPIDLSPKLLEVIQIKLEPLFVEWVSLQRQKSRLKANCQNIGEYNPAEIEKLEDEIADIHKIKEMATPLISPANSAKLIKNKIDQLDEKITAICAQTSLDRTPFVETGHDWEMLLATLSRMRAYESLIDATHESATKIKNRVGGIFNQYLKTVESLVQSDQQITLELEKCLSLLSEKAGEYILPGKTKNWHLGSIMKDLVLRWKGNVDKAASNQQAKNTAQRDLSNAKMAIDYALGRLGELHANLKSSPQTLEAATQKIEENHEKMILEYGQIKQQWRDVSAKHNLPENCSIKALLKIISSYGEIIHLGKERDRLSNVLNQQRNQLINLEKMIESWQTKTGSQKAVNLKISSILLGEAKSIIEYEATKASQLKKLHQNKKRTSTYYQHYKYIDERMKELLAQWVQVFKDFNLPILKINRKEWQEFFDSCHRILSLSSLIESKTERLRDQKIFSTETQDYPLTIYALGESNLSNRSRLALIQYLESAPPLGFGILLLTDSTLYQMLQKNGFGCSLQVQSKPKNIKENNKNPLLSPKAKAAIELLTSDRR